MKRKFQFFMAALALTRISSIQETFNPTAFASGQEAAPKQPQAIVSQKAPDFSLVDTHGKKHALSDYKGKYVVLEWVNFKCPFVGKHYNSGNMQKLQKIYTAKGVAWLSICSSATGKQGNFPPDEINAMLKEKGAAPT